MVKKKALILILSYNAEKKILSVLDRIPDKVFDNGLYETDILILDDASHDLTYNKVVESNHKLKGRITIYRHPVNLGYGGNQKSGYRYAIDNGYDAVVLLHGDGQYAPEMLHDMLEPVVKGEAEALFGSRMKKLSGALKGGMPLYKFVGNIILSRTQNFLLGANLSEFHSGYRTYSVHALNKIRFECNSDWFDFDTDIIIQLLMNGFRIKEIEIPTYYGDEVCHVNGMKYAFLVIYNTVVSRLCLKNLMYVRKYDPPAQKHTYVDKTSFLSSQSFALANIPLGSKILDLGCGEGYVSREAKRKGCEVIGVDWKKPENIDFAFNKFIESDIETLDLKQFSDSGLTHISMLDVIEHLKSPEKFLDNLREAVGLNVNTSIIITTPNIAFFSMRLALLFGNFSYRKAGIMDMTHTRLFTFTSLIDTLKTAGFKVEKVKGIPAPFPLVLGKNPLSKFMLKVNMLLIALWKSMFAYQIAVIAKPTPTARQNLTLAVRMSEKN